MPGFYLPPNRHPTSPGDHEALSRYAGRLRAAAKKLQAISDDADAWVCFYADGWQGEWKDQLFAVWCEQITANDAMNASAWAQDRANFVHANPRLARLYDLNSDHGQTCFRVAIDSCNSMADWLDGCSQTIRQEEAQSEAFFLDALIIIVSVGVSIASLGSLSAPAMILAGALIGGVTAGAIDATNQGVYNQYGLQNGFNWDELAGNVLTGVVVGGFSTLCGLGLGQLLVKFLPAGGVTTFIANSIRNPSGLLQLGTRIGINATGFGLGTFASEVGMQAFTHWADPKDFKTGVDLGQAGQDALYSAGFSALFEGVHAGLHPNTAHVWVDTPGGHYEVVAQPDGTSNVYGPAGGGGGKGPLLGTGEFKFAAVVAEDGSAIRVNALEVAKPDGTTILEPLVNSTAVFVSPKGDMAAYVFDQNGSEHLVGLVGTSDGVNARFNVLDASGNQSTLTVTRGWRAQADFGTMKLSVWDPARPGKVTDLTLTDSPFPSSDTGLGPLLDASAGQTPVFRETPELTSGDPNLAHPDTPELTVIAGGASEASPAVRDSAQPATDYTLAGGQSRPAVLSQPHASSESRTGSEITSIGLGRGGDLPPQTANPGQPPGTPGGVEPARDPGSGAAALDPGGGAPAAPTPPPPPPPAPAPADGPEVPPEVGDMHRPSQVDQSAALAMSPASGMSTTLHNLDTFANPATIAGGAGEVPSALLPLVAAVPPDPISTQPEPPAHQGPTATPPAASPSGGDGGAAEALEKITQLGIDDIKFGPDGAPVSMPIGARILVVGAGPGDVPLGLPTDHTQHTSQPDLSRWDPALVNMTLSDIAASANVVYLDATKPIPEDFKARFGKFDAIVINNPYHWIVDPTIFIDVLNSGGSFILQGQSELGATSALNVARWSSQAVTDFARSIVQNGPPAGFRIVELTTKLPKTNVLGRDFKRTKGTPLRSPDTRIVLQLQPAIPEGASPAPHTVHVSWPRGYVPNLAAVGSGLRPGDRIEITGRVATRRGGTPNEMQAFVNAVQAGQLPAGFRLISVDPVPVKPKPDFVLGKWDPRAMPNTRVVIEVVGGTAGSAGPDVTQLPQRAPVTRPLAPLDASGQVPRLNVDPFPGKPAAAPAMAVPVVGIDPAAVLDPASPEFERLWKALWHLQVSTGLEHAVVQTEDGRFLIVSGGKYEILDNPELHIRAVYLHVHPYWLPPEGPSPQDIRFLATTPGQDRAFLLEAGAPPKPYTASPELHPSPAAQDASDPALVAAKRKFRPVTRWAGPRIALPKPVHLPLRSTPAASAAGSTPTPAPAPAPAAASQIVISGKILDTLASSRRLGWRAGALALRIPWMPPGNGMPFSVRVLSKYLGSDPGLVEAELMQISNMRVAGKPTGYALRWLARALASPRFGLMNSRWAFRYNRGSLLTKVTLDSGATYLVFGGEKPPTKFTYTGPNLSQRPRVAWDVPQLWHPPEGVFPLGGGFAIAVGHGMNLAPYIQTGQLQQWVKEGQGSFRRAWKLSGPGPRTLGPFRREGAWREVTNGPTGVSFMGGSLTAYGYGVTLMWGPFSLLSLSIAAGGWAESETATTASPSSIWEGIQPPFQRREEVAAHPFIGLFLEPFQFTGDIARYMVAGAPELYAAGRLIPGFSRVLDFISAGAGKWLQWDAFHPTFGLTFELDNFKLWRPKTPAPPTAPQPAGPPTEAPATSTPRQAGVRPKPKHVLRPGALPQTGAGNRPGTLRTTPLRTAGTKPVVHRRPPPQRPPAPSAEAVAGDLRDSQLVLDSLRLDALPGGQPPLITQAVRALSDGLQELQTAADALIEASPPNGSGTDLAGLRQAVTDALTRMDERLQQAQELAAREQFARDRLREAASWADQPQQEEALTRLESTPLSQVVTSTREAVQATRALLEVLNVDPALVGAPAGPAGDLLGGGAVAISERLLGASSAVQQIVAETGRDHAVFDRSTGTLRMPQSQVDAIARAFAGASLNGAEVSDLVDAVLTLWHELNHGSGLAPGPRSAPDSYALEYGRNLEEGSVEWNARATVADFAEAAGILDAAGQTRELFLTEALMTGRPLDAHVAMAKRFGELGGAQLLGFRDLIEYRREQAVQTPATRSAWMAGRIIAAQGLPDTAEVRGGLMGAVERGFSGHLGVLSPSEEGRLLGERALSEIRAEVVQARTGRPGPGPVQVPSRFEPELPSPAERVVRAEIPRGIGHDDDQPQFVELRVPAVTSAGERINAAQVTPTPSMTETEFMSAAAHRLQVIQASLPGAEGQTLARVEGQALKAAWRFEETRRVTDLLVGGPVRAARQQTPPDVVSDAFQIATDIVDRYNDPTLTNEARQAAIRAEVAALRARVAGTALESAIPFEAVDAAVNALQGTASSGLVQVDAAGNLLPDGPPSTLQDLFQDVLAANRVLYENGVDLEYLLHVETPRFGPSAEIHLIARPRAWSVSPPGVPTQRLAALGEGVVGRFVVEIGAGSGSYAVDMVPAGEQEASILVQTEVTKFALYAQMQYAQQFGLFRIAPRSGPNSVVFVGDALANLEQVFGRPGQGGGVRRILINNVNAHLKPGQYNLLAQGLRAVLAEGGQVEVQWDDSPEDSRGTTRGHIRGPELRDALVRAGVAIEYREEPGIPYPYDVTPPGGERPGRAVPRPPDPTSATGGRAVIRRLSFPHEEGGVPRAAQGKRPEVTPDGPQVAVVTWQPTEAGLVGRVPKAPGRLSKVPGDHMNTAYLVQLDGGGQGVFKPETGVNRIGRQEWRAAELWRQVGGERWAPVPIDEWRAPREVASARTDRMLGFGLVPTTTFVTLDEYGTGSLQDWVDGTGALPVESYDVADQQKMAVLDYVLAHSDRGPGNLLTSPERRPVAIDNGDTLPASATDQRLCSPFLDVWFDQPLSPDVLRQVRAVAPEEYRAMLLATGLSEAAAAGAVARLEEIQRLGRITGEVWDGAIIGARDIIRGRR